jgi:hypothetical protein
VVESPSPLRPVPFSTATFTDEGAGRGSPVIESVVALIPSTESIVCWSCGSSVN